MVPQVTASVACVFCSTLSHRNPSPLPSIHLPVNPRRRCSLLRTLSAAACILSLTLYAFALFWHSSYRYYGAWSAALTHGCLIYEEFTPPLQSPHRWGGSDVATCST